MKKTLQFFLSTCLFLVFIFPFDSQAQYTYEREWGSKSLGLLQFQYAREVASNSLGEIFVNDQDKIYKYSPDGVLLAQWTSPRGQVYAIFIDNNDDLIVGGSGYFSKMDTDFNLLFTVETAGLDDSPLSFIKDISIDNTNNIYILDDRWDNIRGETLFRILVYSPDGSFSSKILSQYQGNWNSPTDNKLDVLEKIATTDDKLIIEWISSTNNVWDYKIKLLPAKRPVELVEGFKPSKVLPIS
jgi:hypothetical protein